MRLGGEPCLLSGKLSEIYRLNALPSVIVIAMNATMNTANIDFSGLTFAADSEDGLAEAVQISDHPWFIGVQFHPEFTARPLSVHPLFDSFVRAALAECNRHK